MPTPIDLDPKEELVRKHILFTEKLYNMALKDAEKYAGGSLSMWVRMLLRKHYGIKERNLR